MRACLSLAMGILLSVSVSAHPGIGIVKDSKGFIYYTDLANIYKFDPVTQESVIIVPHVHSHELYIDKNDNLYGEHLWYANSSTNRFDHYLWRLSPDGKLDTMCGASNAFADFNFSVIRDNNGNEYRVQTLTTDHILKKDKHGTITTMASGHFKEIKWLQPQDDGRIYFTMRNSLYCLSSKDSIQKLVENVANDPTDPGLYRIWRGPGSNDLYIACYSDGMVKKIDSSGEVNTIYTERDHDWAPTGGVFDNEDRLWVMEISKNNEVRVIRGTTQETDPASGASLRSMLFSPPYGWFILIAILCVFTLFMLIKKYGH